MKALLIILIILGVAAAGNLLRFAWQALRHPEEIQPDERDRDHSVW